MQSFLMPPLGVRAKFFSDNLVVSYSPFSNANKINNKWYVNAKIACIYFEFFCRWKKRIWQENKYFKKEGKSAICYLKQLGFSNWRLWQQEYRQKGKCVSAGWAPGIRELIMNILGFSVTLKQHLEP